MAKARAIVKRLKAVKNIRKITRTMELIATARFKKAMDRATEAAAYTRKLAELVADLSKSNLEFSHPLLQKHPEEKKRLLLVMSSNRGLCGGYNSGVLKLAVQHLRETAQTTIPIRLEVCGKRGISFLKFSGFPIDQTFLTFDDKPKFDDIDVIAQRYVDLYTSGAVDRIDVAYVKFQSISRQTATLETLLPVGQLVGKEKGVVESTVAKKEEPQIAYEFAPSAKEILEEIVPASFKARLFKCFLDAAVSEQIFRMVAMKGATENAGAMIQDLTRTYNRARQAQITSELSEIIGGAAALEN